MYYNYLGLKQLANLSVKLLKRAYSSTFERDESRRKRQKFRQERDQRRDVGAQQYLPHGRLGHGRNHEGFAGKAPVHTLRQFSP